MVITGYALAYAVGVPLYGRISDLFGVRRVFALGLLGFDLGGLICALAPNLAVLVLGRIVQAIGGAAVPALALVAVAKVLPPGERGGAMGLVASSVGIGSALGPVVGGALGQLLGWRVLFLGTLVLMLLLIPFARRALPSGGSEAYGHFPIVAGNSVGAVGVEGVLAHSRDGAPLGFFYAAAPCMGGSRFTSPGTCSSSSACTPRSACRGSSRSASCSSHSRRRRSCHHSSGWRGWCSSLVS